LNKSLELGANFWNGGELYGTPDYNSMHLLNQYFTKYPENADKVVLSVKGGLKVGQLVPDGSEENIRRSVDNCVRLLDGTKKIDIFECARQDPNFPVEHTVEVLAKCVKEGKIGGIGLSEVDAETIRRAYVPMSESDWDIYANTTLEPRCTPSPPSRSRCRCGQPISLRTTSPRPAPSSTSRSWPTRLWAGVC
jgi:aryl-alcohol dehydrogenase-like predicted oxidoreductase